ncbi:hypothetical protein BpHYR1_034074 [Brachionus plicatilis]|uniref:Uncharacterized protein n=1 Tax=Brachionus plicatilis TaxID=10195 RepID=A0A3M7R8L6_BRAPC|nr:hypothetical protein BpHYR1_034074 [Brachionus plicatilis]
MCILMHTSKGGKYYCTKSNEGNINNVRVHRTKTRAIQNPLAVPAERTRKNVDNYDGHAMKKNSLLLIFKNGFNFFNV